MKAIIYASKSTEDPHGSIERQLAECRKHAEREGWDVLGEFKEEAQSGYHGNRGDQLEAACKLAEQNAPCVLLAHHSDRFARGDGSQAKHLLEYIFWSRRAGVTMASVMDPQTFTEGGIGLIVGAAQGSANHDYSARLADRVRSGLVDSFKSGNWHGRFPDGYKMEVTERDRNGRVTAREVTKDPVVAPAIERMFKLGLEQRLAPAAIARDLNQAGLLKPARPYRGKTRAPEAWRPRDVKRILRNPFYAGLMTYVGVDSRHEFPTYVTEQEHETLLARYPVDPKPEKGTAPQTPGRRAKGFVLQRLAVCSCGANMYCSTRSRKRADGSQQREYICAEHKDGTGRCNAHIDADYVDSWVVKGLVDLISDFWSWHDEVLVGVESQRAAIRSRLEEALAEIDKLDRRQVKAQAAYEQAVDQDDQRGMEMATLMAERAHTARPGVLRRVEQERTALAEFDDENVTNAMLDTVNRLRGLSDAGTEAANEALAAEFDRFIINVEANTITPVAKAMEPFSLVGALQRYEATKGQYVQP